MTWSPPQPSSATRKTRMSAMEDPQFDRFLTQVHRILNRRQGVRVIAAGLTAVLGAAADETAAACKGIGGLCRRNQQCCSSNCKKRVVKKKGKVEKEKGACSKQGKRCNEGRDCCRGLDCEAGRCVRLCDDLFQPCDFDEDCCTETFICANNTKSIGCPGPVRFCCGDIGSPCETDCDCCGEVLCFPGGCGTL